MAQEMIEEIGSIIVSLSRIISVLETLIEQVLTLNLSRGTTSEALKKQIGEEIKVLDEMAARLKARMIARIAKNN